MMADFDGKPNSLTESSIWVFTKQSISFDTAFRAVKLFAEMPESQKTRFEGYFAENYLSYGIDTHRHRVLVISQLFGLLTKTPPYKRAGAYNRERPTEVFEQLSRYRIGSPEYNTLKTEQILKLKIRAIIDTADNNLGWDILPVVFSYRVLKEVKERYGISSVDLNRFYTYAMTCSSYDELDDAVKYIGEGCAASDFVSEYKDRSRFLTLCQSNFKLFNIDKSSISINETFDGYFNNAFMERYDIGEMNARLARDVDYVYFLTTTQGFGVNLIDSPQQAEAGAPAQTLGAGAGAASAARTETEEEDADYVSKVNGVKEFNINPEIGNGANRVKPTITTGGSAKRYGKNPILGKLAIQRAGYLCENENSHVTFTSGTTNRPYMEAHHLIPISNQEAMWERFAANIDCTENLVSLCPSCHRAIHYAAGEQKIAIIKNLYSLKLDGLKAIGIELSLEELTQLYFKA